MALCRIVVPTGFVVLAVLGAVVTPPVAMLLVAPLIGAGLGLVVRRLSPAFPDELRARRATLLAGATGAAFVPFTNGVTLLGDVGGVVALVLVILGSCLAANWLMDIIEDSPSCPAPRDDRWMRVVLPSLPTAALLKEWRATQAVFSTRPDIAARTRAVQLRGCLLEEFARRDPAAVERWLTGGDWSSGPRIRPDREVAD